MAQLIPFSVSLAIVLEFVTLSKLVLVSSSKTSQEKTAFSFSFKANLKLKQAL